MRKGLVYYVSVLSVAVLFFAVVLTGCSKSSSDSPGGSTKSFSGENLTITHSGGKFLAPDDASVSVDLLLDDGVATVKLNNVITGFPSVIESCLAATRNDTVYFVGEADASSVESIAIAGAMCGDTISFDYTETISSPTVGKWMLGEQTTEGGLVVPDVEIKISSSDSLSKAGTALLQTFLCDQSYFWDYVQLDSNGRMGIYHKDYHAEAYISRDDVNKLWSTVRAGFFIGDIVSPGLLGQLSFFQDDKMTIGVTISNTFVSTLNMFLRESIDIPVYIPFNYKVSDKKLDIYMDQDILRGILTYYGEHIMASLEFFTYDVFLKMFPEEVRGIIERLVTREEFNALISYAKEIVALLLDESTTFSLRLSFIEYVKGLRPWEIAL